MMNVSPAKYLRTRGKQPLLFGRCAKAAQRSASSSCSIFAQTLLKNKMTQFDTAFFAAFENVCAKPVQNRFPCTLPKILQKAVLV